MTKPKVLFLTRKWPPAMGGMEVYARELARALEPRVELDLRALPGRADGRPPSAFAIIMFGLATALDLLLKGTDASVVHGADLAIWPLVWIARLRRRSIRAILSAHGSDIALVYRRGIVARLYGAYLKFGIFLLPSAIVLANSRATTKLCESHGFSAVKIVPLATHLADCEIAEPQPYILFAGRLTPAKGCGWFIREVLPLLNPSLGLVVAGIAWNEGEKRALENPRVTFSGPVYGADLARLRAHATAVIVPNLDLGRESFEGFGLTAVEGAAAGGVVLASDVYGVADAVRDGVTGFLLPPGDAQSWAAKICEIAEWNASKRSAFIEASRAAVARDYCWTRVTQETLETYQQAGGEARAVSVQTSPGMVRE